MQKTESEAYLSYLVFQLVLVELNTVLEERRRRMK